MNRGDIYTADLAGSLGSEQKGCRPVLIVQNDVGNKFSVTTIVVPLTTANKPALPTHVSIALGTALCEQIRCVDKSRLSEYLGTATPWEMDKINTALVVSIGLK